MADWQSGIVLNKVSIPGCLICLLDLLDLLDYFYNIVKKHLKQAK